MRNKFLLAVVFIFLISFSFISAEQLKVTQEHPFLIEGEWVQAKDLKVGDELTTIDGKKAVIKNITDVETEKPFLVYNLEAGKYSNFVVGDEKVIVHNSNGVSTLSKCTTCKGPPIGGGSENPFTPSPTSSSSQTIVVIKDGRSFIVPKDIAEALQSGDSFASFSLPTNGEKTLKRIDSFNTEVEGLSHLTGSGIRPNPKGSAWKKVYFIEDASSLKQIGIDLQRIDPNTKLVYKLVSPRSSAKVFAGAEVDDIVLGQLSLGVEARATEGVNEAFRALGKEDFTPQVYIVEEMICKKLTSSVETPRYNVNGYMVEEELQGISVSDFIRSDYGRIKQKYYVSSRATPESKAAFLEFDARIKTLLSEEITGVKEAFKLSGYKFYDAHNTNIWLSFRDSAGKAVSLEEIFSQGISSSFKARIMSIDLGGIEYVGAGRGDITYVDALLPDGSYHFGPTALDDLSGFIAH